MLQKVELKQRIIGGIVLVSLAVILVPFLMDDPREEVKLMESNVPPWPDDLPKTVIEIGDDDFLPRPKPLSKPKSKTASNPVSASAPVVDSKSKPTTKADGKTKAKDGPKAATRKSARVKESKVRDSGKRYEVQVVSYGAKSRKRANAFLKRMQSKGYNVRLSEVTRKGKKSLRIVTEPLASKKEAMEMSNKIDREFKVDQVKSMVRSLK